MKKPIKSLPFVAAIVAIIAAVAVFAMQPRRKATSPPAPPPASEFQRTVAAVGLIPWAPVTRMILRTGVICGRRSWSWGARHRLALAWMDPIPGASSLSFGGHYGR